MLVLELLITIDSPCEKAEFIVYLDLMGIIQGLTGTAQIIELDFASHLKSSDKNFSNLNWKQQVERFAHLMVKLISYGEHLDLGTLTRRPRYRS